MLEVVGPAVVERHGEGGARRRLRAADPVAEGDRLVARAHPRQQAAEIRHGRVEHPHGSGAGIVPARPDPVERQHDQPPAMAPLQAAEGRIGPRKGGFQERPHGVIGRR